MITSPSPSPYSAPNTPIASAKRPRTSARREVHQDENLKSPVPARKLLIDDGNESESEKFKKLNLDNTSSTTSTSLFSPSLKFNGGAEIAKKDESVNINNNHESTVNSEGNITPTKKSEPGVPENKTTTNTHQEESHEEEEEEEEFNPYLFISSLPPYSSVCNKIPKASLPRQSSSNMLTLVLDLDETLVHCTIEPIAKPDLTFPVPFNGNSYQVFVKKRPYLDYFLETVSKSFEVVVFTASQRVYAEHLLNLLDPDRRFIQHRLFRDSCLCVLGNFIKDLEVLNRDLSKTVLVDNSPHAYGYQLNNGVPIESWFDDESDTELLKLIGFLRRLQGNNNNSKSTTPSSSGDHSSSDGLPTSSNGIALSTDVRDVIRSHFKSYLLVERAASGQATVLSAPRF